MLGRLEMDVDECIEAYEKLMKTVFEKKESFFLMSFRANIKARFAEKALEKAVKEVVENCRRSNGQKSRSTSTSEWRLRKRVLGSVECQ